MSIDKLDSPNYSMWASDIKLWLKSLRYEDHLTQTVTTVVANKVFHRTKLMPNYASLSSPPLTLCWNKCFAHMKHVQSYGHRQSYYTPMTLSVFMVFLRIFSLLLLREILVPWLNIWVKFMPFFMILVSSYLLPPLQLKNLSNSQSFSCC